MKPHYLLDTNILSELGKPRPNAAVVDFVYGLQDAWLSIITLHELEFGLQLLPQGKRRLQLESVIFGLLDSYADRVISVDQAVAHQAALLKAQRQQAGQVMHLADALIAGSAVARHLTLITRNTKDFVGLPVQLLNPYAR